MKMYIAPINQGQIVEISYGWDGPDVYRRVYDRSDRSSAIRVIRDIWAYVEDGSPRAAKLDEWDPHNDEAPRWLDRLIDEEGVVVSVLPDDEATE